MPARLPVLNVDDHSRALVVAERRAGDLHPDESRPSRRVRGRFADQRSAFVRGPVAWLGLEVEHYEAAAALCPGAFRGEREVEPRDGGRDAAPLRVEEEAEAAPLSFRRREVGHEGGVPTANTRRARIPAVPNPQRSCQAKRAKSRRGTSVASTAARRRQ